MVFTFILTPSNGEKVTYAMTILLAFLVTLFSVRDAMPPFSNIPLIQMLLITLLLTNTVATLLASLIRRLAMHPSTLEISHYTNRTCLIAYILLTTGQYSSVVFLFLTKMSASQKLQELEGSCTYDGPQCEDVSIPLTKSAVDYLRDRSSGTSGKQCYIMSK